MPSRFSPAIVRSFGRRDIVLGLKRFVFPLKPGIGFSICSAVQKSGAKCVRNLEIDMLLVGWFFIAWVQK